MRLNAAPAIQSLADPEPRPELVDAGPDQAAAEPELAANYLDQYGLAKPPFGSAAGPAPFLAFKSHRTAFESLVAGLRQGRGHLLLIGDAGVGKTACLAAALDIVADNTRGILRVSRILPGPLTRLRLVAQILDIAEPASLTPELMARARTAVSFRRGASKPPILAIDDAQYLTPDALDWVLRVAGGRSANMPQVLLAGRPGIGNMLAEKRCKPFVDRVTRSLELLPLTSDDMRQYVERRLWLAGSSIRRLIGGPALRVAIRRAEGSPGRIETLLEAALATGFMRGEPTLTARTIRSITGRPPRRTLTAADWGRVATILAVVVLLLGMAAFVYRALTGP
jgi:general secretion pathway protein A